MSLIEHFESHFGIMAGGFQTDADDVRAPFPVIRLPRGPIAGTTVLATLGLSGHALHSPYTGRELRIEIVMLYRSAEGPRNLPGVLHQVAAEILRSHHALCRGDVVGPWGPLFAGATTDALYAANPVYFPESFWEYTPEDGGPGVAMVWLAPITASEADFVRAAGWERFEDELVKHDPDLLNFQRPSVALPVVAH